MNNRPHIPNNLNYPQGGLPTPDGPAPFSVPEGYFDGLAASILAKAKAGEASSAEEIHSLSPLLASVPRTMPYAVPPGYFEQSLAGLTAFASETESTLLQSIGTNTPYTVPQGYFEAFSQSVLDKVSRPQAKVVRLFARRWMRIAAAAVVSGALCVAGLRYLNTSSTPQSFANNAGSDTAQNQIAKTGKAALPELKTVSTTELKAFVKEVRIPTAKLNAAQRPGKVELKTLLKDVSATEMEAFLSEVPTPDEDIFITDVP